MQGKKQGDQLGGPEIISEVIRVAGILGEVRSCQGLETLLKVELFANGLNESYEKGEQGGMGPKF